MQTRLTLAAVVLAGVALLSAREPGGIGQDAPAPAPVQPPATPPGPEEAAAREILSAMAKAYTECSSYRDSGTVTSTPMGWRQDTQLAFETAFVRGGSFRFEYSDSDGAIPGKPYIVWTDGKDVRTWWYLNPGMKTVSSLGIGVAGASGVSYFSAHSVPRLLLPDIGGWPLTDVVDPRVDGEEAVSGHLCLKVVAKHPKGSARTMWIDKQTHLLRQILVSFYSPDTGGSVEQTTTYAPEVNVTIDPAELAFNPPQESKGPKK